MLLPSPTIVDLQGLALLEPSALAIVGGLLKTPKAIDSLLLWDDVGQRLYNEILAHPFYYPAVAEHSLIENNAKEIASKLSSGTTIIEMGAGNVEKTYRLLRALGEQQKSINYLALDVAVDELTKSLAKLQRRLKHFPHISIRGLLGRYESCVKWIENNKHVNENGLIFLWLGTSVGNEDPSAVSQLLTKLFGFAETKYSKVELLIGIDGCLNIERLLQAYDLPGGRTKRFIENSLVHANRVLQDSTFESTKWRFQVVWNALEQSLEFFTVAEEEMMRTVHGNCILFRKGERVSIVHSRKYTFEDMEKLCALSGLAVAEHWIDQHTSYGLYLIR